MVGSSPLAGLRCDKQLTLAGIVYRMKLKRCKILRTAKHNHRCKWIQLTRWT